MAEKSTCIILQYLQSILEGLEVAKELLEGVLLGVKGEVLGHVFVQAFKPLQHGGQQLVLTFGRPQEIVTSVKDHF